MHCLRQPTKTQGVRLRRNRKVFADVIFLGETHGLRESLDKGLGSYFKYGTYRDVHSDLKKTLVTEKDS